jgi:hypothetical protein
MYTHPHPDPAHVMRTYRRDLLNAKKKFGSSRALVHGRVMLQEYLAAKREVLKRYERKQGTTGGV